MILLDVFLVGCGSGEDKNEIPPAIFNGLGVIS